MGDDDTTENALDEFLDNEFGVGGEWGADEWRDSKTKKKLAHAEDAPDQVSTVTAHQFFIMTKQRLKKKKTRREFRSMSR